MDITQLQSQLDILCTPKWKFWISKSKKSTVRNGIIAQGPKIVPSLMETSAGTQSSSMTAEITLIVKSFGSSAIPYLARAGAKARDFDSISAILYTLLKFSKLSAEMIPCLVLWMSPLTGHTIPTSGSKEMDKMIRSIIKQLPGDAVRWYVTHGFYCRIFNDVLNYTDLIFC